MNIFSETYNSEVTWMLSIFQKREDDLVTQINLPIENDAEVRELLGYNENESLVGEHPVSKKAAERIKQKYKVECDVGNYDIFLGVSK